MAKKKPTKLTSTQLKLSVGEYIHRAVFGGESFEITRRGKTVAVLYAPKGQADQLEDYTKAITDPITPENPKDPKEVASYAKYAGRRMTSLLRDSRQGPTYNLKLTLEQLKVLWTATSTFKNYTRLSEKALVVMDVFDMVHNALQAAEKKGQRVTRLPLRRNPLR